MGIIFNIGIDRGITGRPIRTQINIIIGTPLGRRKFGRLRKLQRILGHLPRLSRQNTTIQRFIYRLDHLPQIMDRN